MTSPLAVSRRSPCPVGTRACGWLSNASVRLPANAVASIGQTSLLGEKFVELSRPAGSAWPGHVGGWRGHPALAYQPSG